MKKVFYIFLGLFFVISVLYLFSEVKFTHATNINYYISSSQGNDSNNGTSEATPWKSLSKIYTKSYSSAPFGAGDHIFLKSGDTFDGQIWIKAKGTAASPVVISSYGAGTKPIITGEVSANWTEVSGYPGIYKTSVGAGSIISRVYDGTTKLSSIPWNADQNLFLTSFNPGSYGPATNTDTIYVKTSTGASPANVKIYRGGGVWIWSGSSYITIENLSIQKSNTGIDANETNNINIHDNDISDTFGMGIYLRLNNTNNTIENNTTNRTGNDGIYIYKSTNSIARGNKISNVTNNILGYAVTGDQCGLGLQESTNSLVEKNLLDHSRCGIDYYYETGSTVRYNYLYQAGGIYPVGTNLIVHNNIINLQSGGSGMNALETGTGRTLLYNNTLYNAKGFGLKGSSTTGKIIFRNNAIYGNPNSWLVDFGTNCDSDYNLFYVSGSPLWHDGSTLYNTLATYQSGSTKDVHSYFSDPQFISVTPLIDSDFKIKNTSPLINKGLNLKTNGLIPTSDPYKDYNGVSIPQEVLPDIGAYEYISSSPAFNIVKSVDKTQVGKGEIITYVIQYSATSNITNARIEDAIPINTTYVDSSASNSGTFSTDKVIWNLGNLASGANGVVSFQVKVN